MLSPAFKGAPYLNGFAPPRRSAAHERSLVSPIAPSPLRRGTSPEFQVEIRCCACCLSLYGIRLWCLLAQGKSDRSFPVCWAWRHGRRRGGRVLELPAGRKRWCSTRMLRFGTNAAHVCCFGVKPGHSWIYTTSEGERRMVRTELGWCQPGCVPSPSCGPQCSVSIRNGLREDPQLFLVVRSPIPYKVYEGAKFMSNLVTVYDGVLSHLQLQPSLRLPSVAQHVLDSVHGNLTFGVANPGGKCRCCNAAAILCFPFCSSSAPKESERLREQSFPPSPNILMPEGP